MARLRKFCAYRRLERPYTRKSKYRKLSYIKTAPNIKIVRFVGGNLKRDFSIRVDLLADQALQIRHNAIEAARLTCNRYLEKNVGKLDFRLVIRTYPHHTLRENPLASGAGADRMSTGMKKSFGKAIGKAAQVRKDQAVFSVFVEKKHINAAKKALHKASYKFPQSYRIAVTSQQ
ncbi:MAG: 50S ribosomal protein L16 [Candidatus Nanoarchaeia archaeon]